MQESKRRSIVPILLIALVGAAAYSNTLGAPYEFDDYPSLLDNPSLIHLWPLSGPLSPPTGGATTSGRPLLNLSFALNHAISAWHVWSYHALNILIHICAALTLYGIVRRTLSRWSALASTRPSPAAPDALAGSGAASDPLLVWNLPEPALLALAVALLWVAHPLQTEAVTYIVQRAESLMGLFFLLTLYCFVRGSESDVPRSTPAQAGPSRRTAGRMQPAKRPSRLRSPSFWWYCLSVLCCLLGAATKEVIAVAPLLVLLYDRTFVSGGFREAWRRHGVLYGALAASWVFLGLLVIGNGGDRGGTSGFAVVGWWKYFITQFPAVVAYFKLSIWPHPLVFEYGTMWYPGISAVAPSAVFVFVLLAGTAVALWRAPVLGFLGAWIFGILATTSLIPGVLQMIVEHRMYLPLAAVLSLLVVGGWKLAVRLAEGSAPAIALRTYLALIGGVVCVFGFLSFQRNKDYRDPYVLWGDTIAKAPRSAAAHNNYGLSLSKMGRKAEAIEQLREAIEINPRLSEAHYDLGLLLAEAGKPLEAVAEYDEAVRISPKLYYAAQNAGLLLYRRGDYRGAIRELMTALAIFPDLPDVQCNLGLSLAAVGRYQEAVECYAHAAQMDPKNAETESDWGVALEALNDPEDAITHFERALVLKPDVPGVHFDLGVALDRDGRTNDSLKHYAEAVRLKPDFADAQLNLGIALSQSGKSEEALSHLQAAVRLEPNSSEAHGNLGIALAEAGRFQDSIESYRRALELNPDYVEAHYNLGLALLRMGRLSEARRHFERALELQPGFEAARKMLEHLPDELNGR